MDKLRSPAQRGCVQSELQIDTLISAAEELPMTYQERATGEVAPVEKTASDESRWQKLWREIWQEVKQLVRIQNTGKVELPLLPPEQEFFLRENLKLRLSMARMDLMSRDEVAFK